MVRVSLTQIIVVYLLLVLAVLFAIWVGMDFLRKRREMLSRRHKIMCSICGVIYEDKSDDPLPKCPNCESVNERARIQDI